MAIVTLVAVNMPIDAVAMRATLVTVKLLTFIKLRLVKLLVNCGAAVPPLLIKTCPVDPGPTNLVVPVEI